MTVKRARIVFAVLMQAAREGKHLTQYDKQQLSIARQVLRQIRKPVMNPESGFVAYVGDHTINVGSDLKTAFRLTKEHSKRSGEAYLYDVSRSKMIAYFVHGVLKNQRIKAEHADVFIHNPPKHGTLIYAEVNRIIATKRQKHICDAECKRHGHRYFHDFTSRPKMYGLPNGDLLITTR